MGKSDEMDVNKFDGTHYPAWAFMMKAKLEAKGVWTCVEKDMTPTSTATSKAMEEFTTKSAQAKYYIAKSLAPDVVMLIDTETNPYEIWKKLHNYCMKSVVK